MRGGEEEVETARRVWGEVHGYRLKVIGLQTGSLPIVIRLQTGSLRYSRVKLCATRSINTFGGGRRMHGGAFFSLNLRASVLQGDA